MAHLQDSSRLSDDCTKKSNISGRHHRETPHQATEGGEQRSRWDREHSVFGGGAKKCSHAKLEATPPLILPAYICFVPLDYGNCIVHMYTPHDTYFSRFIHLLCTIRLWKLYSTYVHPTWHIFFSFRLQFKCTTYLNCLRLCCGFCLFNLFMKSMDSECQIWFMQYMAIQNEGKYSVCEVQQNETVNLRGQGHNTMVSVTIHTLLFGALLILGGELLPAYRSWLPIGP